MPLLHVSLSRRTDWPHRLRILGLSVLVAATALPAIAQQPPLAGAPAGAVETGAPAFVVLGTEALGLSAAPTDLHQLPDGRLLLVTRRELALGDGVRWEVFRQSPGGHHVDTVNVNVDTDGGIYVGIPGGFARIEFGSDGTWSHRPVATVPQDTPQEVPVGIVATAAARGWYWHAGSGAIVSWRPGQPARVLGELNAVERIFSMGTEAFASEQAAGTVHRIEEQRLRTAIPKEATTATNTITCAAPFDDRNALVGTNAGGLHLFDGTSMRPFVRDGLLAGGRRINDLCAASPGFYVAALDSVGLVFFDRTGRIVQMLPGSLDQRLARVQRLHYTPGGIVWALLNEGLARIEFPSRLSHFGPLVPTGLAYAQPIRHAGRLWLLTDGRVLRGEYTADGRLERFTDDTPPGDYVHSISALAGPLLASNEAGIHRYDGTTWRLAAPGPINARINIRSRDGRRWLYVARGEIGWLTPTADRLGLQRFPVPGLGDNYGVPEDRNGIVWAELGNCQVGRIDQQGDTPQIALLGAAQGLGSGWTQVFILDGEARFNVTAKIQRYDETLRRFVDDTALGERYPPIVGAFGRPARDTAGRLWIARQESVLRIDESPGTPARHSVPLPAGIQPSMFTMEAGGAIWMHEARRLTRYDPTMPQAEPTPLRAIITRVQVGAAGRTLYPTEKRIPALAYADNSLLVHFLAPGDPFGPPVGFEVKLQGAEGDWFPTGSANAAAFNRLKEGNYILHVRPRAGSSIGEEATLAFTIEPPWFRTPLAYVVYVATIIASMLLVARTSAWIARREKARLERVVTRRTRELHESNQQLASQMRETLQKAAELKASEDRFRRLNEELEQRVAQRTAELHGANERLVTNNRELESFSYSISHDLRAPLRNISGFADLLQKRTEGNLDGECTHFLGVISSEATRLGQLIDSLLAFSRLSRTDLQRVTIRMGTLFAEARSEFAAELATRSVEWRIADLLPDVSADPTLLRQVLVNLIGNALKFTRTRTPSRIEFGLLPASTSTGEYVFFVRDNGVGFNPKYTDKLFGVFQRLHHARDFEGSGIGLANVRRIVMRHGGRVWADAVLDQGATIYFSLPIDAERN